MPRRAYGYGQRSGAKVPYDKLVPDGIIKGLRDHPDWVDPDHPQRYPISVEDRQALDHPLPEVATEDVTVVIGRMVSSETFDYIDKPVLHLRSGGVGVETTESHTVAGLTTIVFTDYDTFTGSRIDKLIKFEGSLSASFSTETPPVGVSIPVPDTQTLSISMAGSVQLEFGIPVTSQSLGLSADQTPPVSIETVVADTETLSLSSGTPTIGTGAAVTATETVVLSNNDVPLSVEPSVGSQGVTLVVGTPNVTVEVGIPNTLSLALSQGNVTATVEGWGVGGYGRGTWGHG